MMVAEIGVARTRKRNSDAAARAAWRDLSCRRRQYLAVFGVLAPLTGLVGPIFMVPAAGALGWVFTGMGLLACVALLFHLARLDADLSHYEGMAPHAARARPARTVVLYRGKRATPLRMAN